MLGGKLHPTPGKLLWAEISIIGYEEPRYAKPDEWIELDQSGRACTVRTNEYMQTLENAKDQP